jgi:hypothetical protein
VDNHTILNVCMVADSYGVHIATKHGVEPDAAISADSHITHDGGILGQVGVPSDFRREASD